METQMVADQMITDQTVTDQMHKICKASRKSRVTFYHTVTFWQFDDMDYDRTQVPLTPKLTNSDLTEYMQVINAGRNGQFIIDEENKKNVKISSNNIHKTSKNTHVHLNSPYKSSLKEYFSQRRKTL
jgi:hypothetical protein